MASRYIYQMKSWQLTSLDEIESVAKEILAYADTQKKFAVYGDLGAGKTTLIKAFCRLLGVEDVTSSPTFAIVHEYEGREKIYHFDLYRIQDKSELEDIGFEEYLIEDAYLFIEWPGIAEKILRHYDLAKISIELGENQERLITLER